MTGVYILFVFHVNQILHADRGATRRDDPTTPPPPLTKVDLSVSIVFAGLLYFCSPSIVRALSRSHNIVYRIRSRDGERLKAIGPRHSRNLFIQTAPKRNSNNINNRDHSNCCNLLSEASVGRVTGKLSVCVCNRLFQCTQDGALQHTRYDVARSDVHVVDGYQFKTERRQCNAAFVSMILKNRIRSIRLTRMAAVYKAFYVYSLSGACRCFAAHHFVRVPSSTTFDGEHSSPKRTDVSSRVRRRSDDNKTGGIQRCTVRVTVCMYRVL